MSYHVIVLMPYEYDANQTNSKIRLPAESYIQIREIVARRETTHLPNKERSKP
jgi:hypothetical protein